MNTLSCVTMFILRTTLCWATLSCILEVREPGLGDRADGFCLQTRVLNQVPPALSLGTATLRLLPASLAVLLVLVPGAETSSRRPSGPAMRTGGASPLCTTTTCSPAASWWSCSPSSSTCCGCGASTGGPHAAAQPPPSGWRKAFRPRR